MSQQAGTGVAPTEGTGCFALIFRLLWIIVGNLVLLFLAVLIAQRKGFSALDLAFWAVVGALVLVRYIDITRLKGLTTDSQPATIRHWRRYAVTLAVISVALWALAHVASSLGLL
jgi:hypothetical protein